MLIKKIVKLSQKVNNLKYFIIATYLFLILPICTNLILPHSGFVNTLPFRIINLIGLLIFWFCSVVMGRLSGITQGFSGYLIVLSIIVYENFSFLLGSQFYFVILFILGTIWLIYDLMRAFLYTSTLAKLDFKTLGYNVYGNLIFFIISYCLSYGSNATLAVLTDGIKGYNNFISFFYYLLHILTAVAAVLSVGFYLYNLKKRVNRMTIWGNCFLIASTFIYTFLFYFFVNLVFNALFYHVIAVMILGSVLVIPININKESLKNHDLATNK